MNVSSVLQIAVLLAMISAYLATDASFGLAASRRRISIRKYRTNYRIDSWDDGRDAPYRVTFWKFGLKSVYTFDVAGNIKTLTARNTLYTFDTDIGAMLLLASNDDVDDDAIVDVDVDPSSAIDCSVCHVTWDTLCDKGITDVCYLHENPLDDFDEDAIDSVRRFCSAFGAACEMSAADACDGQCTVGEFYHWFNHVNTYH